MLKKLSISIIFVISFFLLPQISHAANYYVSTSGNDTTGAGTSGNPWKTIGKVQSVLSAGDTVYCSGNFGPIEFDSSYKRGTDGNWITYQAWPLMTAPTITTLSFERTPLDYRINFVGFNMNLVNMYSGGDGGASYVTFDDCHFVGAKVPGVFDSAYYAPYSYENTHIFSARTDNPSHYGSNITIKNCHFMYGQNAIGFNNYYHNVLIENNEMEEFADNGIKISGVAGHDFLIRNNNIHDGNCYRGVYLWPGTITGNWASHIGEQVVQATTGATGLFFDYKLDDRGQGNMYVYVNDPNHIPDRETHLNWTLNGEVFFTSNGVDGDNSHSDGISIEGTGTNFDIYQNVIHTITGQGIKTGAGAPQNVRIVSNLIYNTGSQSAYFETGKIYLYNNTIDSPAPNLGGLRLFSNANITMFNNIINNGINAGATTVSNYNIWASEPSSNNNEGLNSRVLSNTDFTNLFVNRNARDYKLVDNSIAINAGTNKNNFLPISMQNQSFNNDLVGNLWTTTPSIGAYESTAVAPATFSHGDIDKNGIINLVDAAMAASAAIGATTLDEEIKELADVSNDGTVTAYDAALILQRIANIITTFPAGD